MAHGDEIIGKEVRIKKCPLKLRGTDNNKKNPRCLCDLEGKTVTIEKKIGNEISGVSLYEVVGFYKWVSRKDVILPKKKKPIVFKDNDKVWSTDSDCQGYGETTIMSKEVCQYPVQVRFMNGHQTVVKYYTLDGKTGNNKHRSLFLATEKKVTITFERP